MMLIDEPTRLALSERLRAGLGSTEADTLMAYLPPTGWADVATRADVTLLEREIKAETAAIRQEFAVVRAEMAAMEHRLEAKLERSLNDQTRALFVSLSGVLAAYTAAVLAAVRFLG